MPNAPAGLSWDGGASAAGRMEVYCKSPIAGGDSNQVFQVRPPDFHGMVVRCLWRIMVYSTLNMLFDMESIAHSEIKKRHKYVISIFSEY